MHTPKSAPASEKSGDQVHLDPLDVIIQDEDLRGRKFAPSKTDVKDLAESIMANGQLQPIMVRFNENRQYVLVYGRTRLDSVKLINGELDPKHPRKITATITDKDEKSSFLAANDENKRRKATTPIDEAFNHQVMRDRFQMKDADIARDCGVSAPWVSKLKKLSAMSKDIIKQVHEGNLSVNDALSLSSSTPEEQSQAASKIAEVAKANAPAAGDTTAEPSKGKKSRKASTETRAVVREARAASGKKDGDKGDSGAVNRTVREVRAAFETLKESFKASPEVANFCDSMVKYVSSKISDKQLENAILKLAQAGLKETPKKSAVEWTE